MIDPATQVLLIDYATSILGGVVFANIVGGLLHGGGGVVGRTIFGAIAGGAVMYAVKAPIDPVPHYADMLAFSMEKPYGDYLKAFLGGGAAGLALGLVAALIIRPRG